MANKFITGNSFSTGDQVTSTKLNESINLATFDSGAVDDSTTAISSGAIIVKDGGVSPSKISTGGPSWDSSGNVSVSGNIDVDGTTNLDAVDIDGNVQVDGTVTVGVNDTGHDVKFFGDTSGAYIQFDASADKLLTAGGATVDVVKDKLLIGGTAVTTTAAELNVLDGVTAGTITASKGVVVDSNKDIASLRNITLTGELDAGSLDVSGNADIDGTLETDALSIDGTTVTSTAAELNILDGVTSTTAELNILDGVTSTASEINLLDGSTANTVVNSKAVVYGSGGQVAVTSLSGTLADGVTGTTQSSGDNSTKVATTAYVDAQVATSDALSEVLAVGNTTGSTNIVVSNGQSITTNTIAETTSGSGVTIDGVLIKDNAITASGEIDGGSLDISGDADIDGTLEADAITVNGTALDTVIAGTTVTNATNSAHVLVTDNESTNEENLITFVEGATSSTGNVGLEMDGNLSYNPSTGTVSSTVFKGNIDAVDGDFDGTLEADAITIGGTAIGSLFSPIAGGSDIVTTGALNSGSITSGFGNIDIGSSNLTSTGSVSLGATSFNDNNITNVGSIALDTITNDGTDVTIDSSGDIILDADGADIRLKDDGTQFGRFANSASNLIVASSVSDKDILFNGSDGGVQITALTLDMSAAGAATFNDKITAVGTSVFTNLDISGDIDVDGTTNLDAVDIDGAVDMASTLTVAGDTVLNSDLEINVNGASNSSKAIVINSSGTNFESDDGMIRLLHPSTGSGALTGGFFMKFNANSADKFTVKGNGDTAIAGNIDVDGTANLDAVDIDGAVQIDSTLTVGVDDTGHDVKFFGATSGSYMLWDESTDDLILGGAAQIGVGTTSPQAPIHTVGDTAFAEAAIFANNGSASSWARADWSNDQASGTGIVYRDNSGNFVFRNDNSSGSAMTSIIMAGGSTAGNIAFYKDSSNEIARFDSNGKLGIGTSAPGHTLDVSGEFRVNGGGSGSIVVNDEDSSLCPTMTFLRNGAGTTSNDFIKFENSGGEVGSINSSGGASFSGDVVASGNLFVGGTALAQADSLGVTPTGIIYSARASGSATHAIFYNGSSVVGSITTSTSATAFNTSSDYRLKENETNIIDGIDRLKQLSPYRFNFKVDPDETVDGFFAHEVSDIVPEAITGTKDGMKDEEYEVSPAVYEDVVHPAVDAVYEDVVHPATYEEVVHPAVEATYDEDGNELTPATEEYREQVLLTEEYTEQVLVTEAVEEWTESVLVTEAVMDTRSVPDYQGIDQSKLVPLLTAALQEAVAKIEALEARVQTLEG